MANNTALIAGGVGCAVISLCCVCGIGGYFIYGQQSASFPMPGGPTTTPPIVQGSDTPVPAAPGYQEVRGDGFAYNVPMSWQEAPATGGITRMHTSKEFPGRSANLNTEPFVGTADAYLQASLTGIRTQSQITVVGQRPTTVGALPGFEIDSIWTEGGVRIHLLQLGTVKNGRGFVLSCADLEERFAEAKTECLQIFSTFRAL